MAKIGDFVVSFQPLPGAAPAWHADVDGPAWRLTAHQVWEKGGRLIALWAGDEGRSLAVHAALGAPEGLLWLTLPLSAESPEYPDLADLFAPAGRMQRAAFDLVGVRARGAEDTRRWLRHAAWPAGEFPLRRSSDAARAFEPVPDDYAFVSVQGEGVHEIAVGPVHAGIIEPGHFRFSVVGERVLRLEERLGYVHKGIEKRFESLGIHEGHRLAGRVSGDSTVAYAWAYAMAAEGAAGVGAPLRALWLRALFLERERVANHLGDLGYLANDAGLAFGLAQLSRLKEDVLRTNAALFGHRYLMDRIVPGGVASDLGVPLSREYIAAFLHRQRIDVEAGRERPDREFIPEQAGCFEQALRLGLQAGHLHLDKLAETIGDRASDLGNGSSQAPPAILRLQHAKRDKLVHYSHHEERIAVGPLVDGPRQL
jgi:Ni,Fe-hydrogenase III component G